MKLAIIRIRGMTKVRSDIQDTLFMFGLAKKHTCVVLEDSAVVHGMLNKIKDYVTYGPVSDDVIALLSKVKSVAKNDKTVYFLAPPRKGFERGGIKKGFNQGGALGDRKDAINALITRMVPE